MRDTHANAQADSTLRSPTSLGPAVRCAIPTQDLLTLANLLAAGQVTPVIDGTHPLDEAADALRYVGGRPTPRTCSTSRHPAGPKE